MNITGWPLSKRRAWEAWDAFRAKYLDVTETEYQRAVRS